jgi:hypothetical protein
MSKANRYSPQARERAVRMVLEHERDYWSQWQAIFSIASILDHTNKVCLSYVMNQMDFSLLDERGASLSSRSYEGLASS